MPMYAFISIYISTGVILFIFETGNVFFIGGYNGAILYIYRERERLAN